MAENAVEVIEAEIIDDNNVVKLSKPLASGTDMLIFDFDKITGFKLVKAAREAKKDDPQMVVPALSQAYQAHVAAIAAGVKYEEILALNAIDFTAATVKVQAFLLGAQDRTV